MYAGCIQSMRWYTLYMNKQRRVTIYLPQNLRQRLDERARAERRSRSNTASVLLDAALGHRPAAVPVEPHRITMESQHHDCR